MALQRPNNRKLLNKDEEDEKKKQQPKQTDDYFVLPTFEEQQEIERTAKEDAAMTVSSGMRRPLPTDIGRTSANAARQELSDRIEPLMEQKRKVEKARTEYEAYPLIDRIGIGSGATMARIDKEALKRAETEYDRMRMTDDEFERNHKADFDETIEQLAQSAGYGIAKSFGMAVDIAKATGAGVQKAIAGFTDPVAYETSSLYKEFRKGYQQELAKGESLYDEIDAEYRQKRENNEKVHGKLNAFTDYVDQAAHSGGEMAPIMWLASMGGALLGGTKLFASIGAKAQSMMASGNKAVKLLGKVLRGVTPGNIASGAGLYVTSSASGTKEAVNEMQNINAQYEAVGLPPKYTDEEIEERAALYGFLTGITEAGGEHAIGGLYGTSTGGITKSIKNPLIKAAASWLIGGIGEGVEESLQTLASYGLKNTVYDAGVSVSWREVLDSGIVGFIMGETTAFPTAVYNTRLGIKAQNAIADALKTAGKVRNDAEAGVAAVNASARAKAYAAMAEEVRKSDSDNAETVAEIYDWMAERMQQISDAMTDDKKRAEIVARNSSTLDEMNRIADRYGIADGIADTKRAKPEDVARMTQYIRDYEQKNGISITDRAGAGTENAQGARAYSMDANQRSELIDRTGRESGAAKGTISLAHDVSSITGRGIRFYRQEAQNGYIENGYYDPDTDTVYINTASKNPAAQILAHELTHSVEGTDSYLSLRAMVFDLMRRDGVDIDAKYREKEMLYSEAGYRLRDEGEIAHEVIAEYVEQHLLTDEASIRDLAKENRTLGQRIREWLDSVLAKLGNASAKERDYVRRVRDMYAKALGEEVTTDGGNVNREFSVSEVDENTNRMYLEAIKQDDAETMRKMVDKSAKKHGYTVKAYHGTPINGITVFDEMKIGSSTDDGLFGRGFYFSTNKITADGYAKTDGKTMPVYLKIKKPWWGLGHSVQEVAERLGIDESILTTRKIGKSASVVAPLQNYSRVFTSRLKENGYDSVVVQHGANDYEIVVFDNTMIKSADDITYDDNGSVIPLSERFGEDNPDIRYSVSKSDDQDNKRVMPKRSAAGTKARARQDQQTRMRFEQKNGINITDRAGAGTETAQGARAYSMDGNQRGELIDRTGRESGAAKGMLSGGQSRASEIDGSRIDPERYSTGEGDFRYSISHAKEIEDGQSRYLEEHAANRNVSEEELAEAHRVTEAMVDVMMRYSEIMPEDKIGKVLTNNGSYDKTVENTTICVRTLAYNEFVDRVQEQIGRPLTQMESFLVSQKLYEIATDPQCLYCYVSLDRKSYNEMLLRYMQDRDTAIDKYNKSDKMPQTVEQLYKEFLGGRKDTKNMRDRYNKWISYADNGTKLLSLADIATEDRQRTIQAGDGNLAEQLRDARTYAQSASWAKIQKDYVAYRDEILKLSDRVVKNLNEHYGMRWYSFSDYSAAFIVENMQQITDAAIRGLKGLSYTKDTDFAEIFAPSGMNINISVFVKRDKNGGYYIDERQSADIDRAIALREQYPNVGIVATVTDDDALRWAGEQEWSDVIIPFHVVRTGTDVAEYYKWLNYTAESGDTIGDQSLWDAYVDSLNPKTEAARKKVSKNIYPSEHHNDRETYLNLCQSRGLTPRFARFAGEEWYMKLVNETRRTADETKPMKPIFDEDAAKRSFAKFVKKGGYEGGWYREGVDVDAEARAVAQDVLAGKQANEVPYGRQDVDAESLMTSRRVNRSHGVKRSVSEVVEEAKEIIEKEEQNYGAWGLRVDRLKYQPGEIMNKSHELYQDPEYDSNGSLIYPEGEGYYTGYYDAGELDGTSTVGIDIDAYDIETAVRKALKLTKQYETDDGLYLYVVSGDYGTGGNDINESIIKNATVRKRYRITGDGTYYDESVNKNSDPDIRYSVSKADDSTGNNDYDLNDLIAQIPDRNGQQTGETESDTRVTDILGLSDDDLMDMIASRMRGEEVTEDAPVTQGAPVVTSAVDTEVEPLEVGGDTVTDAEAEQTVQGLRNDIAADEARYRELTDIVMSDEEFLSLMPDEQNAVLEEMQELRARIDEAERIVEDMQQTEEDREDIPMPSYQSTAEYGMYDDMEAEYADMTRDMQKERRETQKEQRNMRRDLHESILYRIKEAFTAKGFDFDKILAKAKDLTTFATVDNTPQRVMEKALGYEEGNVLADMTVNQTAKNETEGIRWLNQYTGKDGVLAKLSGKYHIKPGSKESAAAQMYAEGFYVNEYDEIVEYGDRELAIDFPDEQVQKNIKGLARDPVIRQIYDQTLDAINASRTRNAYPEIQKLDNYYLHFRAMDDTFSRLGVPFNPNDIRAKDLPTDLNGVTADLKPGQPYFASANHRRGKRTSFDLLGGLEKYLTSAKNQIYHIDDIQTLRALRNYIADMYGQGNGLQGLDDMDEDAAQERIKQVYDSHLSTFAKFLNEEANIIAGKTSLIDRGLEGVIGRRGITFLNDVNRQVGANMVGWNISSSLTNVLPVVQAFAKTNKLAFVKGFAQTVRNRIASITGKGDGFAETSDVIVRRKGADRYHRTPWQKASDAGYLLMGMVDDISTEIIARAKYNELKAQGMDAETANRETDKWVSRLMGDRSLGQMPQIFNSKMLGLVTKFQLEVRNQIDAQFYDTIKEAQADYAEIGDKAKRNAKIAAKVTATFAELAIAQHLFGAVFESIAGYNPAFDIIEVLAKVIGLDDDEESEDTVIDNIEQGVLALIEDLPYSSVLMDGGRVPVSAAMPIGDIIKGEDHYGNEVNRLQTAAEALPYYVLPGGYGQIKKTAQGLSMFTGDKPVTGSYTDSGNLRFPVEATPGNVAQAAVFGQWANENARDYFDNERKAITQRQAEGFAESGLKWKEFQNIRTRISKLKTNAEKIAEIASMDISAGAKEAMYLSMVATVEKDDEGNVIGTTDDDVIRALKGAGLDFDDFLSAKQKQASLNADESLSANQRASRFLAWVASEGYTEKQADIIGENFGFASGFRVKSETYQKIVDGGVTPDNAVKVSDALSGTKRSIDKINAIWSTGLTGDQLDRAIKAVLTESAYEKYRIVIDANVPLEAYTWVLDNADTNGNGSINAEERLAALQRLDLPLSELSALWLATGGSEKSNPYADSYDFDMDFSFDFDFGW